MFELRQDQIDSFNEDGFVLAENLIDDETIGQLRESYERLFRGEFETGVTPDEVNWQEEWGDPSLTRQICNGWRADRTVASVVLRADLGRAVATLAEWPGARIKIDNVLWKPSGARPLGFHQDNAYLEWIDPQEILSCWIALDDTSAEGGTVEFVRGSHRWRRPPPKGEFHGPAEYRKYMEEAAREEGVNPEIVPVVVKKGSGSFHHGWTWHGSGENRSETPRRALVLHAMSSATRYATAPESLQQGTGPMYSRYKRFGDDSMDEGHYPILWTRDNGRTPGLDDYITGA